MKMLKMSESIRNYNNSWLHLFNNNHVSGLASQYSTLNYIHLDPSYIVLYRKQITSCCMPTANVNNRKPGLLQSHFLSSFIFKVNYAIAINSSITTNQKIITKTEWLTLCVINPRASRRQSLCLVHHFTFWTVE